MPICVYKMEHRIILKCRVCLADSDEAEMFDLFAEKTEYNNGRTGSYMKLSEKIEYCCGVRIRESSDMPSKVCQKCFDITRIWYNFRQLCINSQIYLESLCRDRDADEDYLECVFDDLQLFRSSKRGIDTEINNDDSASENNDSDNNNDCDMSDGNINDVLNEDGDDSDAGLVEFVESIRQEQKEICAKERIAEIEHQMNATKAPKPNEHILRSEISANILKKLRPPSPSTYMCSICGNVYTKKASFIYHMNIHSNARPHECEICHKGFRQTGELKNHMRRHTGERPYKCSYCDRKFIDRSEKHRHERVHTNTRPYACKICGKSFMYSAILKNHLKLHSGEKDYNCLVCQKSFTLPHQLKAHLQTISHQAEEIKQTNAECEVFTE